MQGFVAQLQALQWYMGEAENLDNPYLRHWVAADLVLMGYRLILAHNRMLFPYHKWLTTFVARVRSNRRTSSRWARRCSHSRVAIHATLSARPC